MKVIINAFWLSACRIAADVLSFVLFVVISRSFGPGGTGEYSYAFAVGTLIALTSTAGFDDYGVRQYGHASEHERAQLWQDILSTQCVQLLVGIVALAIFLVVGSVRAGGWVAVLELSVYVTGWSLSRTFFVPAKAAQSMVVPALIEFGCRIAAILCALFLALVVHTSLPWLIAGFPIAGVLLACLSLRNARRHGALLRLGRTWRGIISTVRGTSSFAGSEILNQFYARADVLLIAYFLGSAKVGLYATDIKFVEVGILPLILLGMAAYPLLSRHAAYDLGAFRHSARDFTRAIFFLSGWLAVAIYCLIPLVILPLFGDDFAPAIELLSWIALLAVLKGVEVAFYRLLFAAHRQMFYCGILIGGTVLIVFLNFKLIPAYGLLGAIIAATCSIIVIDLACACGLARHLGAGFLTSVAARLALALVITAALVMVSQKLLGAGPWLTAFVGCVLFPLAGIVLGLVPDPRRSLLLRQPQPHNP